MNERLIMNLCFVYGYAITFLLFFVAPRNTRSWDLAVANDGGISFFDLDGRIVPTSNELNDRLRDFYVLTYDSVHGRIFFSVNENEYSIFALNMSDKTLTSLVPRRVYDVQGMGYDPGSETLFWTDGNGHTIWKRLLSNESAPATVVLSLEKDVPTGMAISYCHNLLFWANSNHLSASIDRSHLNGSNHVKLITENLFVPLAVTVDDATHKLYWTEDEKGIYYKIERCDLDGRNRELIIRRTNQEPFGLVTVNGVVYWTDTIMKNIWALPTDVAYPNASTSTVEPQIFHDFDKSTPYGIAAMWPTDFECSETPKIPLGRLTTLVGGAAAEASASNLNVSYCLNSGERVGETCRCRLGFAGDHCEVSMCHNFCLNGGQCYLDRAGFAECQCLAGYEGSRCERDLCSGFCLNGGRCLMNNSVPLCSCGPRFVGQRCETSVNFVCSEICIGTVGEAKCNCNSSSSSSEKAPKCEATLHYIESFDASQCQQQRVITIFLICLEVLTVLVVVVLVRKICVLRRRPRIKKRIIINKGVKSQTPMTARPQSGTSEQCEITIENCCNMNICETPCFEPNLRSALSSSSTLSKKTEDKAKLLKSMESDLEGSDGIYS